MQRVGKVAEVTNGEVRAEWLSDDRFDGRSEAGRPAVLAADCFRTPRIHGTASAPVLINHRARSTDARIRKVDG
eukprot:3123655-Rhodomonas_salina.1